MELPSKMNLLYTILFELVFLNASPACGVDLSPVLGHKEFRIRDKAAKILERDWPVSSSSLRRSALTTDYETRVKASAILEKCRRKDLDRAGNPPWADWPLYNGDGGWNRTLPFIYKAIQSDLVTTDNTGRPLFADWSDVSMKWATSAYDHGVPPTIIKIWFACGRCCDQHYLEKKKFNHQTKYEWELAPAPRLWNPLPLWLLQ